MGHDAFPDVNGADCGEGMGRDTTFGETIATLSLSLIRGGGAGLVREWLFVIGSTDPEGP